MSAVLEIDPSLAAMLMSMIENVLPDTQNSTVTPTRRPMSPTRLVRNALSAASELGCSSHQWPISAKEHMPTNSQPTIIWIVLWDMTKNNIDAVNRERKAK